MSDPAGGCPRPPTRDYRPGVSGRPSSGRTKTLQPEQCVGLITDLLLFTVTLSSDNLIEELQKAGLDAEWVLPEGADLTPGQPVVELRGHGRRIHMCRSEISRILLELTDLPTWARGMDRMLAQALPGWEAWPYFTDEHQVWV
ncbi:hypothetical protein [Streptomyces lunaelactis]|uniref:hypothetical protein n=1 Tax=Streptomyces lunaelactis TaxID=1535768 RepID=UPI00158464A9|nr:hypothetical protein [Streptomyces lunaelactis]NUK05711.1 hypothetical protein [Streptomyces lunaelactis]NUK20179.1 hypothetical protein [Streptomyces lunaelactis]